MCICVGRAQMCVACVEHRSAAGMNECRGERCGRTDRVPRPVHRRRHLSPPAAIHHQQRFASHAAIPPPLREGLTFRYTQPVLRERRCGHVCGRRDASTHSTGLLGAACRERVQQRRVFGRGESRPMRMLAPRGARLPPLGLEIIRSDNTIVAANEFHQITRLAILHHTHPSVALVHARLPRLYFRPPNEP